MVVKREVEEPVTKPPKRVVRRKEPVHEDVQAHLVKRSKFDKFFTFFQFIFFGVIVTGLIYANSITKTLNDEMRRQQQQEEEYQKKVAEAKKEAEAERRKQENKGIKGTQYEDLSKLSYEDRMVVKKIMNLDMYDTPEITEAVNSYVEAVALDKSYVFDGSILSPIDGEKWVQKGAWEISVDSVSYKESRRVLNIGIKIKNEGMENGIELGSSDFTLYSYDTEDDFLNVHELISEDTPVDSTLGYIPLGTEEEEALVSESDMGLGSYLNEPEVGVIKGSTILNEVIPLGQEKEGTLVFNMNELTSVLQARNLCLQVRMYDDNKENQVSKLFFLSRTFNESGDE